MDVAVVTEKPSVARDIARVLGARTPGPGVLKGNGYVVTWAIGHLVALAQPHEIHAEWKRWAPETLPLLPEHWPLVVLPDTEAQFRVIAAVLRSAAIERVICATDAGREGELIFRYLYEKVGCRKPVSRLWLSSLTPESIRHGFERLRPGSEFDPLADAARGRSRADWLVGMNLSRATTLAHGDTLHVGRVQTPTLALLVEREKAIRDFVSTDYLEVVATFEAEGGRYQGIWFKERSSSEGELRRSPPSPPAPSAEVNSAAVSSPSGGELRRSPPSPPAPSAEVNSAAGAVSVRVPDSAARGAGAEDASAEVASSKRLPADGAEAARIVARAKAGRAEVESVRAETRRVPPPLLYDLTDLQRHANRLYGMSAKDTLQAAQSLYETKKLLSYPRTDSRHLSTDVAATLPSVVLAIAAPYADQLAPGTGQRPLSKRFVDDALVTDHHALLPTAVSARGLTLSLAERRIYDLVCRRLLMAWHDAHVFSVTTVLTQVHGPEADPALDRYVSSGTVVDAVGWKVLEPTVPRPAPRTAGGPEAEGGLGAEELRSRRSPHGTGAGFVSASEPEGGLGAEELRSRRSPHGTGAGFVSASEPDAAEQTLPAGLKPGLAVAVVNAEAVAKRTRPPRRFTDATLLTAMETAGRTLDDRELAAAMKQNGLGTPATRAEILETLIRRAYVERQGRALCATAKGIGLIERVHPELKSPALTGLWEAELRRIERGQAGLATFMQRIEAHVRELVRLTLAGVPPPGHAATAGRVPTRAAAAAPARGSSLTVRGYDAELRARAVTATPPVATTPALSAPPVPPAPRESRPATHAPSAATRSTTVVAPATFAAPTAPGPPASRAATSSTTTPGRAAAAPPAAPGALAPTTVAPLAAPPAAPGPPASLAPTLHDLLRERFRLEAFRPRQEAVCRAVAEGRDVLLVMPTGAGKSLCYQLPGLARGGTTLVVSPLIALMEDQVAKLQALGLRAERIHSGRDRERSRDALRAYNGGQLDFLFVAPERLSVPGFCEALARRTPALVAVDEAHCISEWGHDFRPDYRLLGERLPQLRPAPVIALTATATPRVQDDIAGQLGLRPLRFIHGFRRENIAIEVARLVPSLRPDVVERVLGDRAQRPAIVYTPTRREADALGVTLSRGFRAAAYHAGMTTAARDRVQADFLSGRLEVIVATIAFGMGVDKPDIRTVIHTALPGTLEGFSQEIGRAGRDGKPSRAILLHSWNDRRTHEYFFDRGYPEPAVLERVFRALQPEPRLPDGLARKLRLESEVVEAALEKLWIHGGARFSQQAGQQLVARGREGWGVPYGQQREHRRNQLDQMQRFADDHACRMAALVRHFGDREDRGQACGTCDVCDAGACLVRTTRPPTSKERAAATAVLDSLRGRDGQSTGRLHAECASASLDRHGFEEVLGGLARTGLLRIAADTFTKDGQAIAFKRAWLTGQAAGSGAAVEFTLAAEPDARLTPPARRRREKAAKPKPTRRARENDRGLVDALTAWRLAEARRAGVPAFRVLQNKTLLAIAAARPQDETALLAVAGFGPTLLKRHGKRILALCHGGGSA